MMGFIAGSPPTPALEAALRRFIPFATLAPPAYGPLALASVVDALLAAGVPLPHAAAIRLQIVFAVQEFCSQREIEAPTWFAGVASAYGIAAARPPDEEPDPALATAGDAATSRNSARVLMVHDPTAEGMPQP